MPAGNLVFPSTLVSVCLPPAAFSLAETLIEIPKLKWLQSEEMDVAGRGPFPAMATVLTAMSATMPIVVIGCRFPRIPVELFLFSGRVLWSRLGLESALSLLAISCIYVE